VQRVGVVPQVGPHGSGEREVLGGRGWISAASQGKPEPEVRVVVRGACLHDQAEAVRGRRVPARVELRSRQGLADAARPRLGIRGALEKLGGGSGTASPEQLEAPPVPGQGVTVRSHRGIRRSAGAVSGLVLPGTGILATLWSF
jgi:hypothetical protein